MTRVTIDSNIIPAFIGSGATITLAAIGALVALYGKRKAARQGLVWAAAQFTAAG
jgi:mevalonate kinase